jgi:hypothetical protein
LKFLKLDGDSFVFQIGRREKKLLLDVLGLYPLIPPSHHQVSHSGDTPQVQSSQKLLEEALADHRKENKRQVEEMLNEKDRFQESSTGFRLLLNVHQVEWLLQVINEVRVGSWVRLGSPNEKSGKRIRLNTQNARYLWAMELCAFFEASLLAALNRR